MPKQKKQKKPKKLRIRTWSELTKMRKSTEDSVAGSRESLMVVVTKKYKTRHRTMPATAAIAYRRESLISQQVPQLMPTVVAERPFSQPRHCKEKEKEKMTGVGTQATWLCVGKHINDCWNTSNMVMSWKEVDLFLPEGP